MNLFPPSIFNFTFSVICESDKDRKKVTDIVVLHNYDYDGYLTLERLKVFMALKK